MNHYFSENPEIKSQKRLIKYTIEAEKFELTTDNGVFSKANKNLDNQKFLFVVNNLQVLFFLAFQNIEEHNPI